MAGWENVVPLRALGVLGYTLYRNVVSYPRGSAFWLPIICGLWLLVAVIVVVARPGLALRAGQRLTADEGPSLVDRQERV